MSKTVRINPDFTKDNFNETPLIYQGERYSVRGPVSVVLKTLGRLRVDDPDVISSIEKGRLELKKLLEKGFDLATMDLISRTSTDSNDFITTLPPEHFVHLTELPEDETRTLFEEEVKRGIYTDSIKPEDFWVNPNSHQFFLIALDKLRISE